MTSQRTVQTDPKNSVLIGAIWEVLQSIDPHATVNNEELFQKNSGLPVSKPANIRDADSTDLTFLTSKANNVAAGVECAVLIAPKDFESSGNLLAFRVEKPRLRFAQLCNALFEPAVQELLPYNSAGKSKIHDSARVSDHALLGSDVSIGENTIVSAGAVIHAGTVIGRNCFIAPGVVIGGTGFGYEQIDGEVVAFPHYGHVAIGDNVEIGANTCIDRGSLQDTVIMSGVKIDNLVHIAHNAVVKSGSLIIAGSVLCGSSDIGEGSWIAPNAVIGEGVSVGKNSLVGFSTVVKKDVPENSIANGNPPKIYPRPEF